MNRAGREKDVRAEVAVMHCKSRGVVRCVLGRIDGKGMS